MQAVHAKDAFIGSDLTRRLACAFTICFTLFTVGAFAGFLADPPDGKAAEQSEQSTQRADKPAVEPGDQQIEKNNGQKDTADEPCLLIIARIGGRQEGRFIRKRQENQIDGPVKKGNRIKQSCLQGTAKHSVHVQHTGMPAMKAATPILSSRNVFRESVIWFTEAEISRIMSTRTSKAEKKPGTPKRMIAPD